MTEIDIINVVIAGAPNFLGFVLLAVYLQRTINRMLDLLERCIPADDDD